MQAFLSVALDVLGVASLAAFAWFIWPPLVLLVVGVAFLVASWRRAGGGS